MDAGGETWGQKKRSWQPVPLRVLFSLFPLNMKWAWSYPEEFLGFNNAGSIHLFSISGKFKKRFKRWEKAFNRTINPEQKLIVGHVYVLLIVLKFLSSFEEYDNKCNKFKIPQLSAF